MNQETQSTEWKRNWRDEFLKSLCGFANAQGGTLEIGREDDGTVIGIDNAHELLEELPNKIRQALGVVPSIVLQECDGKQLILISVETSNTPVSYHGRHYVRSGNTTQALAGNELNNFIFHQFGKSWDGIAIPKLTVDDLDTSAFNRFRDRAVAKGRLLREDLDMSNKELLDSLTLMENGELTRAAVLLFHYNPEKYIFGSYVKVGYFETGADLRYYDEFHGSLITVADEIVETVYRKYFKALISYNGVQRIETYPIPEDAFREAIYNAMVHRDYTSGIPIQINVYPDSATIYNDGRLPYKWTVDTLFEKHRSRPFNPKIAIGFYRAGFIEAWGRGIERITEVCKAAGTEMPTFKVLGNDVSVTFSWDASVAVADTTNVANDPVNDLVSEPVNDPVTQILTIIREVPTSSYSLIAKKTGKSTATIKRHIQKLKETGRLKRIGADKNGHWEVIE